MICEECRQRNASSFVNKKSVCKDCFEELKHNKHLRVKRGIYSYKCIICGKSFEYKYKLMIPLCSRKCRDKHKRKINKDIQKEDGERVLIEELKLFRTTKGGVKTIGFM